MNNKGNIRKAYKAFREDLKQCPDFIRFKQDAYRISYEDRIGRERLNDRELSTDWITVLRPKQIGINYNVPEVYTKESRDLNNKLKHNFKKVK
jgi:hypothetical protein